MGFIEKLRAKYELRQLEQRYTRRDKRTTFYSNAAYVDGEYVYQLPVEKRRSYINFGNKFSPTVKATELFPSVRS